jgi:G3E family GTPase
MFNPIGNNKKTMKTTPKQRKENTDGNRRQDEDSSPKRSKPARHAQGRNCGCGSGWSFRDIYRAKGVVYTTDAPQQRAVLQVVGRRVDISLQDEWGGRTPRTQIVAIGSAGGIDASLLEKTFASCISAAAADT